MSRDSIAQAIMDAIAPPAPPAPPTAYAPPNQATLNDAFAQFGYNQFGPPNQSPPAVQAIDQAIGPQISTPPTPPSPLSPQEMEMLGITPDDPTVAPAPNSMFGPVGPTMDNVGFTTDDANAAPNGFGVDAGDVGGLGLGVGNVGGFGFGPGSAAAAASTSGNE